MASRGGAPPAEAFLASGRKSEKLSLTSLQSKIKCDHEGYESELLLVRNQFHSSISGIASHDGSVETKTTLKDSAKKRKFRDFNAQLTAADTSLQALKKLAGTTTEIEENAEPEHEDGILSNADFQRIRELKARNEARTALAQHGLLKSSTNKIPSSDQLRLKRVDGSMLEVHVKKKLNKAERLAMVKAGREERGQYHARAAVKQKKTGGRSNREKEHMKNMPKAAKRNKVARSQVEKRKKKQQSGKQFRGRKAWQ